MMNGKQKTFGLVVLAALAMGAIATIGASASVSGHFTHDALGGHAVMKGSQGAEHKLWIERNEERIECNVATSEGTVTAATVTTIAVEPAFSGCQTPGGVPDSVKVDTNGCDFVYHSASSGHATFGVECSGAELVITHPNCKIEVPSQTVSGVTYGTAVSNPGNKHELTVSTTVTLSAQHEAGICVFLGTAQQLKATGSTTLAAFSTAGEQVNLTAT
jgi:hypothetical protein